MNERRNDLEIMNWYPQIALQIQNSDRSPLYDVRNPAGKVCEDVACAVMFRGRYSLAGNGQPVFELRRGSLRFDQARLAVAGAASEGWWSQTGSNRRPHACKARALPAELWPRNQKTNAPRHAEPKLASASPPSSIARD